MPLDLLTRYPDTDTELLQQIVNMLAGPDPQSYNMPNYIGQPPFLDTKTQLLYELFLQLRSGGTGGGGTGYEHWRYYEQTDVKATFDDWEAFCEDTTLDLPAMPGAAFGLMATGVRVNLQVSVGPSNDEPQASTLVSAGNVLMPRDGQPFQYRGAYGYLRYADPVWGEFISPCFRCQGGTPALNIDPLAMAALRDFYGVHMGLSLNTQRVRLRWGVELQPPPGVTSPIS
jgi:hypothetical protein